MHPTNIVILIVSAGDLQVGAKTGHVPTNMVILIVYTGCLQGELTTGHVRYKLAMVWAMTVWRALWTT